MTSATQILSALALLLLILSACRAHSVQTRDHANCSRVDGRDGPRLDGAVLYEGVNGHARELYALDLRTGERSRLTCRRGVDRTPHFVSAELGLWFLSANVDGAGPRDGLALTHLGGRQTDSAHASNLAEAAKPSPSLAPSDFRLSPSGDRVAFVSQGDVIVNELSSGRRVARLSNCRSPDWSPDGTRLALACNDRITREVRVYSNDLWTPTTVSIDWDFGNDQPRPTSAEQPSFSPDGSAIAFVGTEASTGSELYIAELSSSGTAARRVTLDEHASAVPDWLNADTLIALHYSDDDEGGMGEIAVVDIATGAIHTFATAGYASNPEAVPASDVYGLPPRCGPNLDAPNPTPTLLDVEVSEPGTRCPTSDNGVLLSARLVPTDSATTGYERVEAQVCLPTDLPADFALVTRFRRSDNGRARWWQTLELPEIAELPANTPVTLTYTVPALPDLSVGGYRVEISPHSHSSDQDFGDHVLAGSVRVHRE